jgi:hypothetical protein
MSWNYRVFENNQKHEIRDVFYDENGDIVHIGEKPCIVKESLEELKNSLNRMILSCEKPIIDYNTGEEI